MDVVFRAVLGSGPRFDVVFPLEMDRKIDRKLVANDRKAVLRRLLLLISKVGYITPLCTPVLSSKQGYITAVMYPCFRDVAFFLRFFVAFLFSSLW